jgi:hypothetical protein
MMCSVTPYFDISPLRSPLDALISRAASSVTFARGWLSPLYMGGLFSGLTPTTFRPFAIISCMLSSIVPARKCEGLQHDGLSHECIITNPDGIAPLHSSKATRCAKRFPTFADMLIMPYPILFFVASHGQHSLSERLSIFAHSLFSKVSRFPTIAALWASKSPMSTNNGVKIG